MERRPLIGINLPIEPDAHGGMGCLRPAYWEAVARAGGVPVLIPPLLDRGALAALEPLDGLLMVGGDDLPGERFGGSTLPTSVPLDPRRERSDLILWQWVLERRLPTLGICLAMQELNVLFGGTLFQDLPWDGPAELVRHYSRAGGPEPSHPIALDPDSTLGRLWDGAAEATVNSAHHQAVARLGSGLRALAHAPDGVVEAIEPVEVPDVLAVQWHPERMAGDARQAKLFEDLVARALDCMREGRGR